MVRGVVESVGLSAKAPPASDMVKVLEALRLRPQEAAEPASENAILEGALY